MAKHSNWFLSAAALLLAISSQPGIASTSDHLVTRDQLVKLRTGCSEHDVTRALGAPENITRWMDGSQSMAYELSSPNDQLQQVYVDLDSDNRMIDIKIIDR